MRYVVLLVALMAWAAAAVRWLRVAQREHYIPGSAVRFAARWWSCSPVNIALAAIGVVSAAAAVVTKHSYVSLGCAAVALIGPYGLSVRGRTSRLRWTRRVVLLSVALLGVAAALVYAGSLFGLPVAAGIAIVAFLAPAVTDAALALTAPIEARLGRRFVVAAAARLRKVRPQVVAITGSFGKTTVKKYVEHLVSPTRHTFATPASYNNAPGISRAVNEGLEAGTEVFVAEVGTYGPGEIREICSWLHPDVAVITAIGPVHLERMHSIANIVTAKAEILEQASTAVLNVDVPELDELARSFASSGRRVVRVGSGDDVDVSVRPSGHSALEVRVGGDLIAQIETAAAASNVACAVGVAVALGVPTTVLTAQLQGLPDVQHRAQSMRTEAGVLIIDDTYNSNPVGARHALQMLASAPGKRRVLVTPGMVELGRIQADENRRLVQSATAFLDVLVVVGRTNARALLAGVTDSAVTVVRVPTRTAATDWVRGNLVPDDIVLYENDLPDHYP